MLISFVNNNLLRIQRSLNISTDLYPRCSFTTSSKQKTLSSKRSIFLWSLQHLSSKTVLLIVLCSINEILVPILHQYSINWKYYWWNIVLTLKTFPTKDIIAEILALYWTYWQWNVEIFLVNISAVLVKCKHSNVMENFHANIFFKKWHSIVLLLIKVCTTFFQSRKTLFVFFFKSKISL